eukprot:954967-Rhodomonas_salina.1
MVSPPSTLTGTIIVGGTVKQAFSRTESGICVKIAVYHALEMENTDHIAVWVSADCLTASIVSTQLEAVDFTPTQ